MASTRRVRDSIVRCWRRWSPWWLRRHLSILADDEDHYDTASEQRFRYIVAVLDGHPQPADYALRYRVKGTTLLIDATKGPAW